MNLTEPRLRSIIRETIDNLLLRECHNQLRIPFSEFGYGHAFIDEFIDWIQYSSEKGVLPKPTITWGEGLRKGYEEYVNKGNYRWESYDSFCDYIKKYENCGVFEFDKNGNLYVERSITMPVPNGNINSEDSTLYQNQIDKYEKNVGGCWAVGHGNSIAYCGNDVDTTIILKGYMFLDDIYWEEFVRLWAREDPEYEVRTYPNGRVMLTGIQVGNKTLSTKSFDGPRILKSTFFGNNMTFRGNFARLGYEKSEYDKAYIDRQGNEYTREEYDNILKDEIEKYSFNEIVDIFGSSVVYLKVAENLLRVCVFGKFFNLLNLKNGKFLSDKWFDDCHNFFEGLAVIKLNGKYNYIKLNGEFLSPNRWFDECENFFEGLGSIKLNGKWNFINQNGEIAFPDKEFTYCDYFRNGFARVSINGKWNFIDRNGNILYKPNEPDQWFDYCNYFEEGLADVQLNDKMNFIKQNGELLREKPIEQWFDICHYFSGGVANVKLNGNWYKIDKNGNFVGNQPQVSESLIRNIIRESIISYIDMDIME